MAVAHPPAHCPPHSKICLNTYHLVAVLKEMTCGLLGLQKLDVMLFSPGKITPGWFFCHSVNERPAVYDIVIKELALQCV